MVIIKKNKYLIFTILIVVSFSTLIYYDFLFGDLFYIGASDSAYQFLPYFSELSRNIKSGDFSFWSFEIGMGDVYPLRYLGDIFVVIPCLFGEELLPYAMIYVQVIKHMLAAVLMYSFFKKIRISNSGAMLGAIGYTFSAVFVVRGVWYHFSSETVLFAAILWALEKYFQDKTIMPLTLSLTLMFAHSGMYYIVLYSVICCVYAVTRYYLVNEKIDKKIINYLAKGLGIILLAGAISCVISLPLLIQTISTSRLEGVLDGDTIKALSSKERIYSAINSFFSGALTNGFGSYPEYSNGLDGPKFYVGVLFVVILPLYRKISNAKIRRIISVFLLFISAYVVCPLISYICNMGISQHYFKLSTLWLCVGVLIIGVYIWDNLILNEKINNHLYLFAGCICGALFSISCFKLYYMINFKYATFVLVIIVLYVVLLSLIRKTNKYKCGVILLFLCEILYSAYLNSDTISQNAKNLNATKESDYGTNSYVEMTRSDDFYRVGIIESNYGSKAMLYDYNGIGYCDDINRSYVQFVFNVIEQKALLEHMYGGYEDDYWLLDNLLGVRYRLIEGDNYYLPSYYEVVYEEDGLSYIKNKNDITLGYMYDSFITYNQISELDYKNRQYNLLNSIVVDDADGLHLAQTIDYPVFELENIKLECENNDIIEYDVENDKYKLNINSLSTNVFIPITSKEKCSYKVDFNIMMKEYNGYNCSLQWYDGEQWHFIQAIDEANIEIIVKDIEPEMLCLQFSGNVGEVQISNFEISYFDDIVLDETISNLIKQREENGMFQINSFKNDHIIGSIDAKTDGIMFLSIPYHKGWTAYVDGKKVEILKVNYGFCGIELSEGYHDIELVFEVPGLREGAIISCIALIILAFSEVYIRHNFKVKRD